MNYSTQIHFCFFACGSFIYLVCQYFVPQEYHLTVLTQITFTRKSTFTFILSGMACSNLIFLVNSFYLPCKAVSYKRFSLLKYEILSWLCFSLFLGFSYYNGGFYGITLMSLGKLATLPVIQLFDTVSDVSELHSEEIEQNSKNQLKKAEFAVRKTHFEVKSCIHFLILLQILGFCLKMHSNIDIQSQNTLLCFISGVISPILFSFLLKWTIEKREDLTVNEQGVAKLAAVLLTSALLPPTIFGLTGNKQETVAFLAGSIIFYLNGKLKEGRVIESEAILSSIDCLILTR